MGPEEPPTHSERNLDLCSPGLPHPGCAPGAFPAAVFTIDIDHPSPFPYSYSLKVYGTLMACLLKGLQSQIKGINKNHDLYQIFSLNNVIYPKIERFKLRYTVN